MFEIFFDYTFQVILFGTMAIGAVSGALGCFAYLRKQSLIGDVIAHSSLFGIMLFFLISYWLTGEGSKSLLVIIPGAIFSGILALMLASLFSKGPRVREDSSLGVMLALFFGSGLFMLQAVQRAASIPGRRGLEGYLFGMAAAMTKSDLIMISIVGLLALSMMLFFWKELKLYAFDPLFSHTIGFHTFWMDLLMITLLVLGIVIGIQCVGVILMIALLITPAAAARQWT
ncbi:MAG: metal ABC transporter permease, partial [Planctomycetota bacterium]